MEPFMAVSIASVALRVGSDSGNHFKKLWENLNWEARVKAIIISTELTNMIFLACLTEKSAIAVSRRSISGFPVPVRGFLVRMGKRARREGSNTIVKTSEMSTPAAANLPRSAIGAIFDMENEPSAAAVVRLVITIASPE